jgi:hypothetical protein
MTILVKMLLAASRSPATIRLAVLAYEAIGSILSSRRGCAALREARRAATTHDRDVIQLELDRWADDGGAKGAEDGEGEP